MAKLKLDDYTSLISGVYVLLVLVGMGVLNVVVQIGSIDLGGEISQIPGMPIAIFGSVLVYGVGYAVRRTRKRMDKLDRIGVGVQAATVFLFFVQPIADAISNEPLIGFALSIPALASYVLVVER